MLVCLLFRLEFITLELLDKKYAQKRKLSTGKLWKILGEYRNIIWYLERKY